MGIAADTIQSPIIAGNKIYTLTALLNVSKGPCDVLSLICVLRPNILIAKI